jgi:UDP-glucose 4-epimerase
MRVLLTGGAGYIGSHTATVLASRGYELIILDNFANSRPNMVETLRHLTNETMRVVRGDIRDTALIAETIRANAVQAVIHFAGLKAVGDSVLNPVEYYANNVQGTISLLQAMRFTGVTKLIFSSSATVYGVPRFLPLTEQHPTSAVNPYGRTKLQVEEMLQDLARSDQDWEIVCLRYFNPVGAHDSAMIGDAPSGVPSNLMPYLAQVATGNLPFLQVFGNDYETPDGTGIRDYIHVMDLAEGHAAALGYLHHSKGLATFNLGTGKGTSVLELLHAFERVSGKNLPYRLMPRRAGDVPTCYADPAKANTVLGWKAKRSLEDMCVSAWRFQRQFST